MTTLVPAGWRPDQNPAGPGGVTFELTVPIGAAMKPWVLAAALVHPQLAASGARRRRADQRSCVLPRGRLSLVRAGVV